MKIFKYIIPTFALILAIGVGFFLSENIYNKRTNAKTIAYGLNDLGILETAQYGYTHVATYDSDKMIFGFTVPLTNSRFIYSYDGTISAGIDFTKIRVNYGTDNLTVHLPSAQIQSSEIDFNSFNLYDEHNNIFNPISVTDVNDSFSKMKESEEQAAIEKGLLEKADKNAEVLIKNFLKNSIGANELQIEFIYD